MGKIKVISFIVIASESTDFRLLMKSFLIVYIRRLLKHEDANCCLGMLSIPVEFCIKDSGIFSYLVWYIEFSNKEYSSVCNLELIAELAEGSIEASSIDSLSFELIHFNLLNHFLGMSHWTVFCWLSMRSFNFKISRKMKARRGHRLEGLFMYRVVGK